MDTDETTLAPQDALKQFWGYDSFRPFQEQAIERVLAHQDTVVVLPTGGGKSLCYQVPAVCLPGVAVVVSPLISLMKDQVDALHSCGIAAAFLNSTLSGHEQRELIEDLANGHVSLLYVSPERLVQDHTQEMLQSLSVSMFAIDEAHCISEWGHDFRPEFRALKKLKQNFPHVGVHAYTATATERVREDIARELELDEPEFLVGSFDRSNLIYKVSRRSNRMSQIRGIIDRNENESGIIYCISRKDVNKISEKLCEAGYKALPYHAGLSDLERAENQEAFIEEKVDIIVATVAFGMGIDKPNIRYVIHAGMPRSVENYQQESGRAGRDGLEAECHLFYSGNDFHIWKQITENSESNNLEATLSSLGMIADYCTGVVCRHKVLVNHFGQEYAGENCGACDVCLGEIEMMDDSQILGQKILSSVVRQKQRFGGDYTALVLKGSSDQRILKNGHDQLSTWGLLEEEEKRTIRDWIEQLVSQGFLEKVGEYNVLQVTQTGWEVLRGEATPRLRKPREFKKGETRKQSKIVEESWEGVDRKLFNELRDLRRTLAEKKNVPAYVIFGDATLREMARIRPTTLENFNEVKGVGKKKSKDYGEVFLERITNFCEQHEQTTDIL